MVGRVLLWRLGDGCLVIYTAACGWDGLRWR